VRVGGRIGGADEGEVVVFWKFAEGLDEEVEAFDGVEATDVADDACVFGPGWVVEGGGVMEARDVDAVGDDGGVGDGLFGLKLIDNCLGGGDEGVGVGGEEVLEGPVPGGFFLEGVDGLDEEGTGGRH